MAPCAANTTRLVCRFRHFTGFIAGRRATGRAGIQRVGRRPPPGLNEATPLALGGGSVMDGHGQ